MGSKPPISFEDHCGYVLDSARLDLFFLWIWLDKHPGETFVQALRGRVDLVRKTDPELPYLDKVPVNYGHRAWPGIEAGLSEIYSRLRKSGGTADEFEAAGYGLCEGSLKACAENSYHNGDYWAAFGTYQCGSLKFDAPSEEEPRRVSFHIKNALAPRSIFEDPGYLPSCLFDLMDKAAKEYGADTLQTETWLNSLPKWLELFPPEWMDNMGPDCKDVGWGYGHWGQFISARGCFNRKYGDVLRRTGDFPFWPRKSHCSFKALKGHLESLR